VTIPTGYEVVAVVGGSMVAGHEEPEGVPLCLVRDLCDHHVATAYQTPGYIDSFVIANWVGGEEGVQLLDVVVTLTVHRKILHCWCHHFHLEMNHQFWFYFPVLELNVLAPD